MEANYKAKMLRAKRKGSITDVHEEVGLLIDTHFFNELSEKMSSPFLKKFKANQSAIDLSISSRGRGDN